MTRIYTHPLRDGVTLILERHFAPEIVSRFKMIFEAQIFQAQNIINQKRDDKVALEVHFDTGTSTEFICDVWSYMSPKQAEYHLLKMITDAAKTGKIGTNWLEGKDGRISEDVASAKFETKGEV